MNNIETLASESITDEPLKIKTIPVREYGFWDRIYKRPKERTFNIYRIRVCNMVRCAGVAHKLPEMPDIEQIDSMEKLTGLAFPLIRDYKKDVVYLVACCIQNNSKEPKKSLIKFVDDNFVADELFEILVICLSQLGLLSFIQAIQALKGSSAVIVEAKAVQSAIIPG